MGWYTVSLGTVRFGVLSFDAYNDVGIESDEVVRGNLTPNTCVARNYRWLLGVRLPKGSSTLIAPSLVALLTGAVNSGTIVTSFKIANASGTALAEIGDVRTGTAEEWEDLRVTSFRAVQEPDVPGVNFEVGFAARRSFPDANGICEFFQDWSDQLDEFGNTVRLRTTEIRLAKSSANTIAGSDGKSTGTAAIATQLKEPLPVGWRRTKGDASRGYTVRFPLYPLLHYAFCESEVTRNVAGATGTTPPTGANKAVTGERAVEDPEKGVRRFFYDAESVGSTDGLTWVGNVAAAFGDVTGEIEARPEEKTYRGKWTKLEPLVTPGSGAGKVTRTKRTFQRTGGEREGGATLMSSPYLPVVTRGPWTPTRLVETVKVYALGGVGSDADIPLPDPLGFPWILVEPSIGSEAGVDEDSRYPAQRLWSRGAVREYLWGGNATDGSARANAALLAAVYADTTVTL